MKKLLCSVLAVATSGCVSFVDTAVESTLPRDVTDRNHVVKTADWRDELVELAGTVLLEPQESDQAWQAGRRIVVAGKEPTLTLIPSDDPDRGGLPQVIWWIPAQADAHHRLYGWGIPGVTVNRTHGQGLGLRGVLKLTGVSGGGVWSVTPRTRRR